jgi:hypothetical protein
VLEAYPATISIVSGEAKLSKAHDGTLEARVSALEEHAGLLSRIAAELRGELSRQPEARRQADEKEAATRARDDADLRQLITHLGSSGLDMEVSGVVWPRFPTR